MNFQKEKRGKQHLNNLSKTNYKIRVWVCKCVVENNNSRHFN